MKTHSNTEPNEATISQNITGKAPRLPAASAHHYIRDMLAELTQIAEQAELKELTALLRVTTTAAETHERFL